MITKQDILKMVKGVMLHSRGRKQGTLLNPERDWGIGLVGFLVVLIGVSFYAAKEFILYLHIEDQLSPSEVRVPNYNVAGIDKVIEEYSKRGEEYKRLQGDLSFVESETPISEEPIITDPVVGD